MALWIELQNSKVFSNWKNVHFYTHQANVSLIDIDLF